MGSKPISLFSPGTFLLGSISVVIAVGAALLALPVARVAHVPIIDLLFTAASSVCGCGLITVPLHLLSPTGQAIILLLIQIGGIIVVSVSLILLSLFLKPGFSSHLMAGQLMETESWGNLRRVLVGLCVGVFSLELIGALLISWALPEGTSFFEALFQSISTFCSAGISTFKDTATLLQNNPLLMIINGALMLTANLGFIPWVEIAESIAARIRDVRYQFSLHSRIVLYGTFTLLIASAIVFWILEHEHALANMHGAKLGLVCLFQAITFKSTGFFVIAPSILQVPTLFLILFITFIGSAPGSTGTGVKITTFVVFLAAIKAALQGKTTVDIRERQIPLDQVFRAIGIVVLSFGWALLVTFCLLIIEPTIHLGPLLLEALSAICNLGISTGITPYLSSTGKLLLVISMLVGKIGSLTLILAMRKREKKKVKFSYPEERVMLG